MNYPTLEDILQRGFSELEAINILTGIENYGGSVEARWYLLNNATPGQYDPEYNVDIVAQKLVPIQDKVWSSK